MSYALLASKGAKGRVSNSCLPTEVFVFFRQLKINLHCWFERKICQTGTDCAKSKNLHEQCKFQHQQKMTSFMYEQIHFTNNTDKHKGTKSMSIVWIFASSKKILVNFLQCPPTNKMNFNTVVSLQLCPYHNFELYEVLSMHSIKRGKMDGRETG